MVMAFCLLQQTFGFPIAAAASHVAATSACPCPYHCSWLFATGTKRANSQEPPQRAKLDMHSRRENWPRAKETLGFLHFLASHNVIHTYTGVCTGISFCVPHWSARNFPFSGKLNENESGNVALHCVAAPHSPRSPTPLALGQPVVK